MSGNQQSGKKYDTTFRQTAKAIYMKHRSLAATCQELRRRGHLINIKTLTRWMQEEDWKDTLNLRDKIEEPFAENDLDKLEKLIRSQEAMVSIARSKVAKKLADGTIQLQACDPQDFHAYNRMAETLGRLYESKRRAEAAQTSDTPVEVIFAAMKKHLKFGKLIESAPVRAELADLIAQEMMRLQRKAVGIRE